MTNHVALVTGAAGGLGGAMARALVRAGYALVLVDVNEAVLERFADALRSETPGSRIVPIRADLSDTVGLDHLSDASQSAFGRVDVLVNNAGLGVDFVRRDFFQRPVRFWELDHVITQRFFAVNAIAPFLLAARLAKPMIARGFGRIVNVTTSLDTMIRGGFAPYGGTKASLEAHSAIMAQDLAGTGVTVNVLIPGGPADTAMIPPETGFPRDKLISPEAMGAPLLALVSPASSTTGTRVVAAQWSTTAPDAENLARSAAPIGWPEAGASTQWPGGKPPPSVKA